MLKVYSLIFLIGMGVLMNGCASTSGVSSDVDIATVINRVNAHNSKIQFMKSEGNISFDTPDMSNSGSFSLNLAKPDSLYTKLEGPFGISIAAILLTKKDFVYYNIQENTVIMGPSSELNLGAILRIRLKFEDVLNGFTDSFILESPDKGTTLKATDDGYLLTYVGVTQTRKILVDPQNYTIKKYSVYEPDGKIKMEAEYSMFTEEKNFSFPNKINISKPLTKEYVQLTYTKKDFDVNSLNYKLKIPKSAKVKNWD